MGKKKKKKKRRCFRLESFISKKPWDTQGMLKCYCTYRHILRAARNVHFVHKNGRMNLQNSYDYNRSKTLLGRSGLDLF